MSKRLLTIALAALFSAWLAPGASIPAAYAEDGDSAAKEAVKPTGEMEEYFTPCKEGILATQTFEPLASNSKRKFLSVRIKGVFETPGPGYIEVWRNDQMPSLTKTAAMELRILRPLNAYIEGQTDFTAPIDKTVVVHPDTNILRIHVVFDYKDDDMTFYCPIKPVSLRARNEMDIE